MRRSLTKKSHSSFHLEPLEPRCLLSATPISFVDGDGTTVKITLSGNGAMSFSQPDNTLTVTGTDQRSSLKISTKGGDGRVALKDVDVTGAIKSISATTTDLIGNISITGNVKTLTIGDLLAGTPHTITIGGTPAASASTLTLRRVVDLDILSGSPIKTVNVTNWDDTGSDDLITAPDLHQVISKGDLAAGVRLVGPVAGDVSLSKVSVKGVLSGTWFIDGNTGTVSTGTAATGFHMNILGDLKSLTTKGDFQGVLAADNLGKISIGGSLVNAKLLSGADLGSDALPGGTGDNGDLYFRGTINSLSVKGQVLGSVIGAGLDPANGVFDDGNDFVTGKLSSTIKSISVHGIADDASLFAAGKFSKISVGGTRVDPAGDPRFLLASTAPDETPPVITAQLRTDTGTDGDGITSDPTIVGRVTDLGLIQSFRVGVDADALTDFVSILTLVQPDGTFELSLAKIEQVNGGPLTVGAHTINFVAKDDAGNTSAIFTVSFVFTP